MARVWRSRAGGRSHQPPGAVSDALAGAQRVPLRPPPGQTRQGCGRAARRGEPTALDYHTRYRRGLARRVPDHPDARPPPAPRPGRAAGAAARDTWARATPAKPCLARRRGERYAGRMERPLCVNARRCRVPHAHGAERGRTGGRARRRRPSRCPCRAAQPGQADTARRCGAYVRDNSQNRAVGHNAIVMHSLVECVRRAGDGRRAAPGPGRHGRVP